MKKLLAFHGKQEIKEKYLSRVKAHYNADEIIHGEYWEDGKGCAVGCTIEGSEHIKYEKELGIPEAIAWLEDTIFEELENGASKKFPMEFLEAITPGADLSKVTGKFKLWLLLDTHNGIKQWANDETKKIIDQIAELQKRELEGKTVSVDEWSAAWSAAESAVRSAESADSARSAAWSAAESAASSAAWSAESADSARSAAWSAAESAQYKAMAKKLLQLLKEAE